MKKIITLTIISTVFINACDNSSIPFTQKTPNCSDEKTISQIRDILTQNFLNKNDNFTNNEKSKYLRISNIFSTEHNENIDKYTCEANLTSGTETPNPLINNYETKILYSSQTNEQKQHQVKILGLTKKQLLDINIAFMTGLNRKQNDKPENENTKLSKVEPTYRDVLCISSWKSTNMCIDVGDIYDGVLNVPNQPMLIDYMLVDPKNSNEIKKVNLLIGGPFGTKISVDPDEVFNFNNNKYRYYNPE